ncbi:hypothetical protein VW29_16690 [Devosia limi DSM 17137]|uniref:Glycosyl transferase family 2 n=1 Tax=Devosia limi DSM 17137 TaxID=1121477 RepID=A0A0F5LE40_9HYPH|nr:glycosyltransferase family A protein [Devosia limi]KKB80646.1 hypothetical protein VW29_16690 [Devosia limi DSM 17137]SHE49752.1 Glycosyl transferase family 2 [Devosia limi DSM 17137]
MTRGEPAQSPVLSVIVPASNEAGLIGRCLDALLASCFDVPTRWQLLVVANGCRDDTAMVARGYGDAARARNVDFQVIEVALGNKLNAINVGEGAAQGGVLAYIDADVVVSPHLLPQLTEALGGDAPAYGTGTLCIARARRWDSRAYGRFWSQLPFVIDGAPGCGVFAVNRAGRSRWGAFPAIISDDTFVRLHFGPGERKNVPADYQWPIVEGFENLVKVRRRQDQGVAEIAALYPDLLANEHKSRLTPMRLLQLAMADPVGFGVYATVALATKLPARSREKWVRGR